MLLEEAKRVLNNNGYVLVESLPKWAKREPRVNVGAAINAGSKKNHSHSKTVGSRIRL